MTDTLLAHEPLVRLAAFAGMFAFLASWEALVPRRPHLISRPFRWFNNLAVLVIDIVVARVLFPASAVTFAFTIEERGWGLFGSLAVPHWAALLLSVVVLDLAIYLRHVLFHAVPILWRLHRMHHADLDFDLTTGTRFHPIEIALSLIIKFAVITALGAPALAVLIFEMLLNATAMFNHANARLPARVDRLLRWLVVTPDMHRVHHSVISRETNSNFGFNLPWWDRLFRTYREQPVHGHEQMTIGVPEFRDPAEQRIDRMLSQPFRRGSARALPQLADETSR